MIFLPALIAFAVATFLAKRFCNPISRFHILDFPNERSLHTLPIPRSGGIAVLAGMGVGGVVTVLLYDSGLRIGFEILAVLILASVSFLDDRFGVNQGLRLLTHFLAAIFLIVSGYTPEFLEFPGLAWVPGPFLVFPLLALFVVWMINLYNFMDGMDGLAGGMTVIGFATFAILGRWGNHEMFAVSSLLVAGAVAGFLLFNLPPAKIFLGDVGSSVLGFLAAAFSLGGTRDGLFPFWLALLIFSPFIVDATVTLGRRLVRGEKVWLAHKTHYYQKLVQIGWGQRKTLLVEYGLMLLCSLSALAAMQVGTLAQMGIVVFWACIYVCLLLAVAKLERRRARPGFP
jgi:UDP-N-acetylmuramyl pentapeptide phosphotransferase/UDP-N-acetylglucosamine-1-phosphate transferase